MKARHIEDLSDENISNYYIDYDDDGNATLKEYEPRKTTSTTTKTTTVAEEDISHDDEDSDDNSDKDSDEDSDDDSDKDCDKDSDKDSDDDSDKDSDDDDDDDDEKSKNTKEEEEGVARSGPKYRKGLLKQFWETLKQLADGSLRTSRSFWNHMLNDAGDQEEKEEEEKEEEKEKEKGEKKITEEEKKKKRKLKGILQKIKLVAEGKSTRRRSI